MIKTVGGMREVLNNYSAGDWVKSGEIGGNNGGPRVVNRPLDPPTEVDKAGGTKGTKTFGDFLFDSMNKVNQLQQDANVAVEKLATGQSTNLHETMIIVEQAEIAFKTMNQIRMKVLDAYKEIMKMQI